MRSSISRRVPRQTSSRSTSSYRLFARCWPETLTQPSIAEPGAESSFVERAWSVFVSRHHRRICHLFVRLLRCRDLRFTPPDIEDYVQDFYCRLLSQGSAFKGASDRELWAYFETIAERLISDQFRLLRREKRRWQGSQVDVEEALESAGSPRQDPERIVLHRERFWIFYRTYLRRYVRGKHARLKRRVLLMALLEGRTSREIAERLDLRSGYVDVVVHRFRRRLEAEGLGLPRRRCRAADRTSAAGACPGEGHQDRDRA